MVRNGEDLNYGFKISPAVRNWKKKKSPPIYNVFYDDKTFACACKTSLAITYEYQKINMKIISIVFSFDREVYFVLTSSLETNINKCVIYMLITINAGLRVFFSIWHGGGGNVLMRIKKYINTS